MVQRAALGRTDGYKEVWVEVGDDLGGTGADEVVNVIVSDMEVLNFVGHDERSWKDKDDKRWRHSAEARTICRHKITVVM